LSSGYLKCILFISLLFSHAVCALADTDSRFLIEITAGEGLSYNSYNYYDLTLEPREFPEFTHELGVYSYFYMLFDWFGLGIGAGLVYNLTGASSAYMEDPTIKYMFHWIKVPLLISLSVNRGTALMYLDTGIYTSLFLTGNRIWEGDPPYGNRSKTLTINDISTDFGIRIQFCVDMRVFYMKENENSTGLGMGLFLEKSLVDIMKDENESFSAFRIGIFAVVSFF
jgi:hypothetical protein